MDCQPKNLCRAPLKGSRHDSSAATHRGGGLERGHTFRDVGNEHSEVAHFIFGFPRRNRGERHATGIALSPPPPLPGGDLHAQPPSQQPEPFNRPPTSPCNDSWGVRENFPWEEGAKVGAHSHHRHRVRSLHSSSRAGTAAEETYASPAPVPRLHPHGLAFVGEKYNNPVAASFASGTAPPVHRRVASLKADNPVAFHQQIWGRGAPGEQSRSGRSTVMAPWGSWRHPLRRRRFLVCSRLTGSLSSGRSAIIPVAASIASGTTPPVHRRVASLKADNAVAFHQ